MKLSQLSLADYNQLDSIPVINQDLSASGFTPVANTYYRHTGATTDTFTQGVIYLYDTAYHKLGESGLKKVTYDITNNYSSFYAEVRNIFNKIRYITYNESEAYRLTPVLYASNSMYTFWGIYSNSVNQTIEIIFTVSGEARVVERAISATGNISYIDSSIKVVNIYYEQ